MPRSESRGIDPRKEGVASETEVGHGARPARVVGRRGSLGHVWFEADGFLQYAHATAASAWVVDAPDEGAPPAELPVALPPPREGAASSPARRLS